jgi:hypothetical protein
VTRGARSSQPRDRWLGRSGKRRVFAQPSRNGSDLSPVCVSRRERFHDGWETRRRRLRHSCSRAYHGGVISSCETRNEWGLRSLSPLCTSCLPSRPYVRRVASKSCVIYTLRAHHEKQTSVLTSELPHPSSDSGPRWNKRKETRGHCWRKLLLIEPVHASVHGTGEGCRRCCPPPGTGFWQRTSDVVDQ